MINFNLKSWVAIFAAASMTVIACKKDDPKPQTTECKNKPTGEIFEDIPNLDFEDWYAGQGNRYLDPSPSNFWATPNQASLMSIGNIKPPINVFRVSGDSAYSGNYAAMLVSQKGVLPSHQVTAATIASGIFKVDIADPLNTLKFGKRFEKRPKTVSGYYKYFPVGGDSASVYCFVTKLDANCKLDTIGFGRKLFYDKQETYARFEFDLDYKNNYEKPDNIVIYFSSSEAGDEFKGQPGNTLFIDGVSVTYHE